MSRILLIDDDTDMLALTGRWLTKAGYEVDMASSGRKALDLLAEAKPDLILLDFCMPEMDGPAVLKAVRENPQWKEIPVLYRTGMDDDAKSAEETEEYRPDGIVPKSKGKPYLMEKVAELV